MMTVLFDVIAYDAALPIDITPDCPSLVIGTPAAANFSFIGVNASFLSFLGST